MGDPVSRQSANTKNLRIVPIVFIPGVMGTRLNFPKDGVSWDPDSSFHMWRKWYKKPPEEKAKILDSDNHADIIDEDVERGWGTVAKDFYRSFLNYLEAAKFPSATCPTYAAGFDWRKSCSTTGDYVAAKIGRAIEKTKYAEKAIVITHSMGGLVTRAAVAQNHSLVDKVLGVIHVVQPVAGAPVLYRRFFTGMIKGWDGDKYLTDILGKTAYSFVLVLSGLPGGFELLPTHQYRYVPGDIPSDEELKVLHGPWESSERGSRDSQGRMVYPAGIAAKRYLDANSPPGLFNIELHGSKDKQSTQKTKQKIATNIGSADGFHEKLGLKAHPNTWAIYSTALTTDVAIRYPMKPWIEMNYRRDEGDSTVPAASGAALFASTIAASKKNAQSNNNRQFSVTGVDHGEAFKDSTVREVIVELVKQMLNSM